VKGVPDNQAVMIVAEDNFHGRTTLAVSLSNDEDSYGHFGPLVPNIVRVPYNNLRTCTHSHNHSLSHSFSISLSLDLDIPDFINELLFGDCTIINVTIHHHTCCSLISVSRILGLR
jgi:adenosylmethionine-8-amino-7-oxononanoate aminotransferase